MTAATISSAGANACDHRIQVDDLWCRFVDHFPGARLVQRRPRSKAAGRHAPAVRRRIDAELAHRHARGAPTAVASELDEHQDMLTDNVFGVTEEPFRTIGEMAAHLAQDDGLAANVAPQDFFEMERNVGVDGVARGMRGRADALDRSYDNGR